MVLEDQGNLSLHAVQADQRYRADQPNPGGLRGLGDPERNDNAYHFYVQINSPTVSKICNIYKQVNKCLLQTVFNLFPFFGKGRTLNPLTPVLLLFYRLHAYIVACFIGLLFFHLLPFVVLVCHFCHLGQA